jgi:hypothetical protein
MGCGISKAKVTPKQQKPEDDLHYDKLDHFKDHGTSVCCFTWAFYTKPPTLQIGNEPFILESFDLELQHKDGKVLSVIINADEISGKYFNPMYLNSMLAAKFSKLTSLMPEKWLSQGLQENLNKTDKISKLSLKLQPNPLEKFNKGTSHLC